MNPLFQTWYPKRPIGVEAVYWDGSAKARAAIVVLCAAQKYENANVFSCGKVLEIRKLFYRPLKLEAEGYVVSTAIGKIAVFEKAEFEGCFELPGVRPQVTCRECDSAIAAPEPDLTRAFCSDECYDSWCRSENDE
jgi:hypothetical protein